MRRALKAAVVLLAGAAVYLLWPAEQRTPEDEVRLAIARAVTAAEKRDLGGVADVLAEDFHGPGGMGVRDMKQLVLAHLMRHTQVTVLNTSLDVALTGPDAATFTGTFVFAGDGASRYEVSGEMERRRGDWVVTSASWKSL